MDLDQIEVFYLCLSRAQAWAPLLVSKGAAVLAERLLEGSAGEE